MSIKDVQDKLIERNSKPKPKKIDRIVKGVLVYWCAFVILAWVTFWVKDSVPFNVAGDIELDGQQIQIKFDDADQTKEKILKRIAA